MEDSDITLYEISKDVADEIEVSGTYTRHKNLPYGAQTCVMELDTDGVPVAMLPLYQAATYDDEKIDYHLPLDYYRWTVLQTIRGNFEDLADDGTGLGTYSVRTEERVYTHNQGTATDEYYIDGVKQAYLPAKPTNVIATKTALFGHPDTVDLHLADIKVWSLVRDMCPEYEYELLRNYTFDCGLNHFSYDPNYPATLTYTTPGEVHLVTNSSYGSVVPTLQEIFPSDDYTIRCKVKDVSGNGKMSIRNSANTWFNVKLYDTDGIYEADYTGNIKDIHIGASNDENSSATYEWISLRKKGDPAPTALLVDENNFFLTDEDGKILTAKDV
jgi:hypothetical protein